MDLDMPSDALCTWNNFTETNPASGVAITCKAEIEYNYPVTEDGDKYVKFDSRDNYAVFYHSQKIYQ